MIMGGSGVAATAPYFSAKTFLKKIKTMKKHYKAYVGGFPGAVELRVRLMEQETPDAVARVVQNFLAT